MKRIAAWMLLFVMLFSACGKKEETNVNLDDVYNDVVTQFPEMLPLDETMMLNYLGVDAALCDQAIAAICADSMRVDELWLIQVKKQADAKTIADLAQTRMDAQAEVCESYSPEQYAVVKEGKILTAGRYVVLVISPESAAITSTIKSAIG